MKGDPLTVQGLIEILQNYPPDLEVREFSLDLRTEEQAAEFPLITVNMGPVTPCGAVWERD